MRLVLDTNVVLSALLWRGAPYQLLTAIRREPERLRLFSSEALFGELVEVLHSPHLAKPLAAIGRPLAQVIADYVAAVELVVPTGVPRISRDRDDDQILAGALTAQANLIVSGDHDLLSLGDHEGIPILPATQALKRIQDGG